MSACTAGPIITIIITIAVHARANYSILKNISNGGKAASAALPPLPACCL
jgi:hypothetical protein